MFGYDFCLCNSLPHLLLRLQILMPDVHVILQPLVLSYFFQSYSLPSLLFLFSLLAHCCFFSLLLLLFNVSPAVTTTGWTLEIQTQFSLLGMLNVSPSSRYVSCLNSLGTMNPIFIS